MSSPARLAVAAWIALSSGAALAFHSGGVGSCEGCHSMHAADAGAPAGFLLKAASPTDVCLRCHQTENGNTWGNDPRDPGPQYGGGAFVLLRASNLNDGPGGSDPLATIPGYRAGHSVISFSNGTMADPEHSTAPGGTYPSYNLHCTSCHDPHGKGGTFRLLYGTENPDARVNGQVYRFGNPAPQAEGIPLDGPGESPSSHTAYRSGMTEWCANCHGYYHENGLSPFEHPVRDEMDYDLVTTYNAYLGSGNATGTGLEAYIPQTPVEVDGATTSFRGPVATGARISCVSCHRAHASSGPRAGRWDFNITTWAEEGVLSGTWPIPNPYELTTGPSQRRLCEKCHGNEVPD